MSESEHLSTHLYSIYLVIIIQPLPEYESYTFHFHRRNNLLDNYHVATSCHFSYLKVAGKEKFPGVLSWTAQQRRRTWSGNSLLKAGRSLSCGEQSAKLVLHPLLLTGPISSGPCFFFFFFAPKVRKKKRKNCSHAVRRRAAFESTDGRVQVLMVANTCPAGLFTSSVTLLLRLRS